MPYRLDVDSPLADAFERLVELGALDVGGGVGRLAAIMPDHVGPDVVVERLGASRVRVSPARGRDGASVWILEPRPLHVGRIVILPAASPPTARGIRLIDSHAFGTGRHPTTGQCLERLDDEIGEAPPAKVLDVGTGSGVLALAALRLGVPRVTAIDTDPLAIRAAAANARLNGLAARLEVIEGGPQRLTGAWPLVVANILAAPLIELAPVLAPRLMRRGRLVLSGIRTSLADDVARAYQRVGITLVRAGARDGWTALVLQASW